MTLEAAAHGLHCSAAKIRRLETGTGSVESPDVRMLLAFYELVPSTRMAVRENDADGRDPCPHVVATEGVLVNELEMRIKTLEARVRRDSVLLLLLSSALVGVVGGILSYASGVAVIASVIAGAGAFVAAATLGIAMVVAFRSS